MTIQHSNGLSLLVGDGAVSESFVAVSGAVVSRFELSQKLNVATAVAEDAWQNAVGTTARRAVIECEAMATGEAAAMRLRSLAVSGAVGNVQLELGSDTVLQCAVYVTDYREVIEAGKVKKLNCRLESSGVVTAS